LNKLNHFIQNLILPRQSPTEKRTPPGAENRKPKTECRTNVVRDALLAVGCSLSADGVRLSAFGRRHSANSQQPTANSQQPTANSQRQIPFSPKP
jgi:hypothetical protein